MGTLERPESKIFLSHASEDADIASALKLLIERCSLRRANVWFSSDTSSTGGVSPGGPWFDQLVAQIESCDVFLALITPRSVANLWLNYETGCAATKRVAIIPVVAGLSVNDVRLPLSLYNAHDIAQPSSLKTFLTRLYQRLEIPHDEVMLETPLQLAIRQITSALEATGRDAAELDDTNADKILRHLDRRFMDLLQALPTRPDTPPRISTFTLEVAVSRDGEPVAQFFADVSSDHSMQDVLDDFYFKLSGLVKPHRYLEQWVVFDQTASVHLIVRDVQSQINATAVFKPGHQYQIILLSKPYNPAEGDFFT